MNKKDEVTILNNIINIVDNCVGKYYDIETILSNNVLSFISMSPHDLKKINILRYKHVQLLNINGLGIGQVHFMTDDGSYLLLPWCYIVSMIPSKI